MEMEELFRGKVRGGWRNGIEGRWLGVSIIECEGLGIGRIAYYMELLILIFFFFSFFFLLRSF